MRRLVGYTTNPLPGDLPFFRNIKNKFIPLFFSPNFCHFLVWRSLLLPGFAFIKFLSFSSFPPLIYDQGFDVYAITEGEEGFVEKGETFLFESSVLC